MVATEAAGRPATGGWGSRPGSDGALLTLAAFAVYTLGACRGIYVGDSGELVAAVHVLGVPHPSGYALYVLLGKLWTLLLPVGSVAFRMSLFSATCAATTVGFLHLLGRRLGLGRVGAACGAGFLAFSPSFWSQANVQRVYSLNALFLTLVLLAFLSWRRGGAERRGVRLVWCFFVCGIGATNHTYLGVFAVALASAAIWSDPGLLRRGRTLVACVVGFISGLTPYFYLLVASRADPSLDWGNPETPRALVSHVLRLSHWERAWLEGPADLLPILADFLKSLGVELLWVGSLLGVLGLFVHRGRSLRVLALLGMLGNVAIMALHGSRSDLFVWHRYYIPSYLLLALFAGVGLDWIARRFSRRAALAGLLLPLALLVAGWREFDRSRYEIAEDFSRTLLQKLPPGAHLAASDDNILFVLIYLQMVEGMRPDVDLILQGVGDADLQPLRFDPDDDPLYFTHHPNWETPGLEVVPVGLVFRTARPGIPVSLLLPGKERLAGETDPAVPKDYLTRNLIGHFHYMLGVTHERLDWPRAQAEFAEAVAAAPDNDVLFYNLGLIYRRNGLYTRSLTAFEAAATINPRTIAANRPARASDRVTELVEELRRLEGIEERLAAALEAGGVERPADQSGPGKLARWHRAMATLLRQAGEPVAARGHELRALEAGAGLSTR